VSAVLTKTSTPRLSDVARHVVVPKGAVSTGWPAIRDKCRDLGISFRWWQQPVGQIILAKRADGKYAATIGGTGLSIPRQVGKTFLVGAIMFALCLLRPNLTVIWTAHRLRTAEETFGKMQKFVKRAKIAPHVLKVVLGSGEEEILFVNGSRILFGARERGFGRGFDEVDVVVYDEGQILNENALDDMIPAMNQSRQETGALLLFMGTPPKPTDSGEVFKRMRAEALSGEDPDTGWVEFGADPDYRPTPLPAPLMESDWKQVAKANPSHPEDTPREAILRMRKKLGQDSFRREGLGVWDSDVAFRFGIPQWDDTAQDVRPEGLPVFFVTMAKQMASATVAVAALHNGLPHVELADHRPGTAWLADRLEDLHLKHPGASFAAFAAGPAKAWVPILADLGVELNLMTSTEAAAAYAHVKKLAETLAFTHSPDELVADALAGCEWKEAEGGGTTLDWRKSAGDVSPFAAEAGALWLLESQPAAAFFASRR
jgi:hypothetical protein